jgi:hypothetical protein
MDSTGCEARVRDTDLAESLLSLFTSADRAAAIAGDLTEARAQRAPIAFWVDVVRTLFSLWRRAVATSPLRVLMLALSACALLVGPVFVGIASVLLFPSIGSPVNWIALSFFWSAGALWTGAALVSIAPARGMAACASLAVAGELLLIALVVRGPWLDLPKFQSLLLYTTSLIAPALLLAGGVIVRRRMLARAVPTPQQP